MRLQAVVVGEDEPRRGEDRHDSATPLPVDGRTAGLRGGGAVPGTGGVWRCYYIVIILITTDLKTKKSAHVYTLFNYFFVDNQVILD